MGLIRLERNEKDCSWSTSESDFYCCGRRQTRSTGESDQKPRLIGPEGFRPCFRPLSNPYSSYFSHIFPHLFSPLCAGTSRSSNGSRPTYPFLSTRFLFFQWFKSAETERIYWIGQAGQNRKKFRMTARREGPRRI